MSHQAEHLPNEESSAVEVVLYVSKDLDDEQRELVVSALKKTDGILGAEFCQTRHHLMLAQYDKNIFSSLDVLKSFTSLNLEAKLIGPI